MDKCPKCVADQLWSDSRPGLSKCGFKCGTFVNHLSTLCESSNCLRRQLAAANGRAGRMEKALRTVMEFGAHTEPWRDVARLSRIARKALEVPDAV
jgi:hypothetical protein